MWDRLMNWLSAQAAKFFTGAVARLVALKSILISLFTVVLPTVINNVFYSMLEKAMQLAAANGANVTPGVLNLTGFGAWLAVTLKLPECVALAVGVIATKVALRLIPIFKMVR